MKTSYNIMYPLFAVFAIWLLATGRINAWVIALIIASQFEVMVKIK